MKKIALVLFLFANACLGQTRIEGLVASFPNTAFTIKTGQSVLNNYAGILIGQGNVDGKGQFTANIDLPAEQPVKLFVGNVFFLLWAKPNTTLTIQAGADGRYIFSGAMAKENTVLYTTRLMQPYTVRPDIGTNSFEPQRQLLYLDSIEAKRLSIVSEAEKAGRLSKKFLSYCKAEISSFTFVNKTQYPGNFKAANKITGNDIPKDYFSFWKKFRLAEDSTASDSYQGALQYFIEYKAFERIGPSKIGTEDSWREILRVEDSLLRRHPLSFQKQRTNSLFYLIKYFNYTDLTASAIEDYKKKFPSSASIPIIENLWQKKQASTAVQPSFRLKDNEGKWVDIKDFRGKVVYIDFWGSWCKACLANMPHAEKLKQKCKGKDVVFLYLDFYDTTEKWLHAIKEFNIDGIHLKAEKSDEEYFRNVFNIDQAFPRYALVDKNGKLVTISAPVPQDPAAFDLIKKCLGE